jgi:hopanoid biosynthesis associated protein HpnK
VRRLIINADDFGLTVGVNRAIAEAHADGVVTSATLMANGAAFGDAVNLAANLPRLGVGCNVILVDGSPVLDSSKLSSLIAVNSDSGAQFRTSLGRFAACAITGRLKAGQVEAEAVAQFRKLQEAGIRISHFDAHKHTHMFPVVLRPLLRAAKACGISAVRNPFTPWLPISLRHLGPLRIWKRYLQVRTLYGLTASFRRTVAEAGMITPDGTFGIIATGALDLNLFLGIVERIPEGTWEFVCHPGYNDAELGAVRTRLRESRLQELKILTSTAARESLAKRGIQLISYRDLVGEGAAELA